MLLTFGAVFAGAGAFALVSTSDTGADGLIGAVAVGFGGFFLLVFGGIGALMMFLGLYSLLNSLGRGNPERQGGHPQELLFPVQADGPPRRHPKDRNGCTQPCWTGSEGVVPHEDSGVRAGREAHFAG